MRALVGYIVNGFGISSGNHGDESSDASISPRLARTGLPRRTFTSNSGFCVHLLAADAACGLP
jgi:hypothetical protein